LVKIVQLIRDNIRFFSIIDVIAVLIDSKNPRRYWSDLKNKMKSEEGSELIRKYRTVKNASSLGKIRLTDVTRTRLKGIN
jgi:hypothetical protein